MQFMCSNVEAMLRRDGVLVNKKRIRDRPGEKDRPKKVSVIDLKR